MALNYAQPDLNDYADRIANILQSVREIPVIDVGFSGRLNAPFWLYELQVSNLNGNQPFASGVYEIGFSCQIFLARGRLEQSATYAQTRRQINDDLMDTWMAFFTRSGFVVGEYEGEPLGYVPASLRITEGNVRTYGGERGFVGSQYRLSWRHRVVLS